MSRDPLARGAGGQRAARTDHDHCAEGRDQDRRPVSTAARTIGLLAIAVFTAACAPGRARTGELGPAPPVSPAASPDRGGNGRRAASAAESSPPRGDAEPPGLAILREDCLGCHTEDIVHQQRLTEAQWAKVLDKMHMWGAPTEPEKLPVLTAYLASTYGRAAGPYAPATLPAQEAAAILDRLPDGPFTSRNTERGHELYADQCAPCHGEKGEGSELGMTLAGRFILDRAPEFAAVLRSGRGRMPGYADFTDADIADLIAHIRTL